MSSIAAKIITKSSSISLEVIISVSPDRQNPQTQQRSRSPVPGPSGIGRQNLTDSLAQAASTVSVVVNVLTGFGAHSAAVKSSRSLPVISQTDLKRRINEKMQRESHKYFVRKNSCVSSRILFEKINCELFFFPSVKTSDLSRSETIISNLSLLDLGPPWGVVVCFFATSSNRVSRSTKSQFFYKEKDGFPEGVSSAVQLYFFPDCFSLLFCETGRIRISSGQAVLEGLELVILQKKYGKMLSLFCKKKTLNLTSPVRPLPLCDNKPFIRVRCCCKAPGFSFFLNIPVFTKGELKREHYNVTSNKKYNIFQLVNFCNHLIVFPDDMGMHLPFDGFIGGKLFCSLQSEKNPNFQLIFIPDSVRLKRGINLSRSINFFNWIDENMQFSQEQASKNVISIYNFPQVTLSFGFELEATILGLEIKLISTKGSGVWGVLLSRKETGSLSASIPQTTQESDNSLVPGPSRACPSDKSTAEVKASLMPFASKDFFQDLLEEDFQSRQDVSSHMDCLTTATLEETLALINDEMEDDILKEINLSHPADLLPEIETLSPLVSFENLFQSQIDALSESVLDPLDVETNRDQSKEQADAIKIFSSTESSSRTGFYTIQEPSLEQIDSLAFSSNVSMSSLEKARKEPSSENVLPAEFLLPDIAFLLPPKRLFSSEFQKKSSFTPSKKKKDLDTFFVEEFSPIESDTSEDLSQNSIHALQSEKAMSQRTDTIADSEVDSPTGFVTNECSLKSLARVIQLSGPSGGGYQNPTARIDQAASTVSVIVNIFTDFGVHFAAVKSSRSLAIIDQTDLKRRINEKIHRKINKDFLHKNNCVNSRILFEETNCELFFFPSVRTGHSYQDDTIFDDLFLVDMGPPWGVIVCFFAEYNKRVFRSKKGRSFYTEKNGLPEGVNAAVHLRFTPGCVSLLFCETGRITISSGQAVLQGLELVILQKKYGKMLSLFCERKTLSLTSPMRSLSLCDNKPFIRVRCCCKAPGFSFFLNIPVLTKGELKKKPYNVSSNQKCKIFQLGNFCNHLIVFPDDMGMNLPFDGLIGGKLVCSLQRKSNLIFQLIFIPDQVKSKARIAYDRPLDFFNWIDKGVQYTQEHAPRNVISIYNFPQSTLSSGFELEKTISGLVMKLISKKISGAWGVFLTREETGSLSTSISHADQESNNSPVPGPSRTCPSNKSIKASLIPFASKDFFQNLLEEDFQSRESDTSEESSQKTVSQLTDTTSESDVDSSTESDTSEKSSQSAIHALQSKAAVEQPADTTSASESEVDLPIGPVATEGFLQSPERVLQSEETSLLHSTGITSIEVETTSSTGSVASETPSQSPAKILQLKEETELLHSTGPASETKGTSPTGSVATEGFLQNPARVFQSEEKIELLHSTGITFIEVVTTSSKGSVVSEKPSQSPTDTAFIEVEITAPTGAVTTEDSTEVSLPSPVCSMTSIHGMQRVTFSIPYTKSVIFYKEINSQINVVTLERKILFSDGKNLLAVLPKKSSFQHGVGFKNAQLSVVKDKESSKISIGFIPINQSKLHLVSHWIHKKWSNPYLSNVKGNLARIQLISLRAYLFECPLSATIKMISSTECVLLGMSVVILIDSNSVSPFALLFAQNESLLSLTEEAGEGSSSNALSTSVHRPQAKRLLPTESKGQAKRKKKNRVK